MLTFSGIDVTRTTGAPNIRDIAVHTMRLFRYGGAQKKLFPVGQHLIVTAAFLPEDLEHHGLLHDVAEALMNDIPYPFKTKPQRALERRLLRRIYKALGVAYPTPAEEQQVHEADVRAMHAEAWAGVVPDYFMEEMGWTGNTLDKVKEVANEFIVDFDFVSALSSESKEVRQLERKLHRAVARARRREQQRAA